MKNKLITILTVTAVATSGLIAVAGVALNHNLSPLGSIEANDTRYLEIKAEDIRDAIGAGSEGTFTVAGIEFYINNASYDNGVANVNGGILETRTTAGQSVSPITGMAGTGYLAAEFVNMAAASGGNLMTKDDNKATIAEHPFGAYTQESYVLDFSEDNTPSRKVSNLFIAFGAGGGISFTSLKFAYKCEVPPTKHEVRFLVDGEPVDTQLVTDGEKAVVPADPVKAADAEAPKYRFTGWDKDVEQAITEDIDFNATFKAYAFEKMVDDFESYEVDADLETGGWELWAYTTDWTKETPATLSLSHNSNGGSQAMRLDAYRNYTAYKAQKTVDYKDYDKAVNALQVSLMLPAEVYEISVCFYVPVQTDQGIKDAPFKYSLSLVGSGYVEYTMPFSEKWDVWGTKDTIANFAAYYGLVGDDILPYISGVSVTVKAKEVSQGSDFAGFIDNLRFITVADDAGYGHDEAERNTPYFVYTGTTPSGNTVRIDIAKDGSGNAVAKVLDLAEPLTFEGKFLPGEEEGVVIFKSNTEGLLTYKGKLMDGNRKIKFIEASGMGAAVVGEMDLDAVLVLDDFEGYNDSGTAYSKANTDPALRQGFRGAYYAEYYSGNAGDNADWGGSKWSLMDTGEEYSLGIAEGNQYGKFENNKAHTNRYLQWDLFDGRGDLHHYRGSTFSFWAKSEGYIKSMSFYAYFQSSPTAASKDSYVSKLVDIPIASAIDEWTHFEIELNPQQTYYGFMFTLKDHWQSSNSYLLLDNVEIYNANPYAEYVAPSTDFDVIQKAEYINDLYGFGKSSLVFTSDSEATYNIPVLSSTLSLSYSISDDQLDLVHNSEHMKATISEDSSTLTFEAVTPSSQFTACFSGATYALAPILENAESFTETGKTYSVATYDLNQISGAGGAYHVDFYKAGTANPSLMGDANWAVPSANNNHVQLDNSVSRDGSQSLKIYFNSGFQFRYIQMGLMRGTATKAYTGYNRLGIWVKNTSTKDLKFKLWAFKTSKVNNSTLSQRDATDFMEVPAGQDWTLYTLTLDQANKYYGYGLFTDKPSSGDARLYVDRVFFFNDYDSIDNYMALKNGSTFDGTIVPGAASITFGAKNAFTFTCANAGKTDEAGTFKTYMEGDSQKVELSVLNTTIVCGYTLDPMNSKLNLTVESATGDLAAYIPVNTVFSYLM